MSITVEELDKLVRDMKVARDAYEVKSQESKALYAEYVKKDNEVMQALDASGKSKYTVDGLGTVSVVSSLKVRTPKTIEEKQAFLDYISNKYGQEVMIDKVSFNYQSLNAFYKEEFNQADNKAAFSIPGLESPEEERHTRWLSERVKKVQS